MKKGEIIICFIVIILSGNLLWMVRDFPPPLSEDDIGPAVFPAILLVTLILLSIIQIFITARKSSIKVSAYDNKLQFIVCLSVLLYVFLIPVLGYVLITPLFLLIITRMLQIRSWAMSIIYSVIATSAIWYFFNKISGIKLPTGIL